MYFYLMHKYLRNISYKLRSNVKLFLSESFVRVEIFKKIKKIFEFWKRNGRFSSDSFCSDDVDDFVRCNTS